MAIDEAALRREQRRWPSSSGKTTQYRRMMAINQAERDAIREEGR